MSDSEQTFRTHWMDDVTYDLAEDMADSSHLGWLAGLIIAVVVIVFAWHAITVYLSPPEITFAAPVAPRVTPQVLFPKGFGMTCIEINGTTRTINPNPIPQCLQWMQQHMQATP